MHRPISTFGTSVCQNTYDFLKNPSKNKKDFGGNLRTFGDFQGLLGISKDFRGFPGDPGGFQQSFQLRNSLRGPPEGENADLSALEKIAEIQQIASLNFSDFRHFKSWAETQQEEFREGSTRGSTKSLKFSRGGNIIFLLQKSKKIEYGWFYEFEKQHIFLILYAV